MYIYIIEIIVKINFKINKMLVYSKYNYIKMDDFDPIDTSLDYYYTGGHNTNKITKNDLNDIDKLNNKLNSEDEFITVNTLINLIAEKKINIIRSILEKDKYRKKYINQTDGDNDSLLHFSIFANNYRITKLFLKYGANLNVCDNDGQTPLFRVIFAKDDKILGLLMEYGSFIDAQDNQGNTVLHISGVQLIGR